MSILYKNSGFLNPCSLHYKKMSDILQERQTPFREQTDKNPSRGNRKHENKQVDKGNPPRPPKIRNQCMDDIEDCNCYRTEIGKWEVESERKHKKHTRIKGRKTKSLR